MSTSTWVPLVTAAAGLIAGLAAGLVSTVLARRWASEDRRAAWQREDRLRWQADRLQAYTRLISALDDWDAELRRVLDTRIAAGASDGPPPFDAAEWERHDRAVSEQLALVQLMAPEQVIGPARACCAGFFLLGRSYLATEHPDTAEILTEAQKITLAIRALVGAMRADLGLGGDGQRAAGTAPRPAGRSGEPSPPGRPGS